MHLTVVVCIVALVGGWMILNILGKERERRIQEYLASLPPPPPPEPKEPPVLVAAPVASPKPRQAA